MANKFKVGDRVRVQKTGALGWEATDWCREAYREAGLRYPNGVAIISHVSHTGNVRIEGSGYIISPLYFVNAGAGVKNTKSKPHKFALQYELDKDPTEYFHTIEEVKKRVKELASNPSLKKDEVFVHEIKNTKKVSITSIIGIKFVTIK